MELRDLLSHPAWQSFRFKKCICLFFFLLSLFVCFHAVIWCDTWRASFCNRRICLRGGKVRAFGIWLKRFVPCTFQLRLAWRRGPSPSRRRRSRRGRREGDGDKEAPVHTRHEWFWRSAPRLLTLKRVFRSSQCSTRGRSSSTLHSGQPSLAHFINECSGASVLRIPSSKYSICSN